MCDGGLQASGIPPAGPRNGRAVTRDRLPWVQERRRQVNRVHGELGRAPHRRWCPSPWAPLDVLDDPIDTRRTEMTGGLPARRAAEVPTPPSAASAAADGATSAGPTGGSREATDRAARRSRPPRTAIPHRSIGYFQGNPIRSTKNMASRAWRSSPQGQWPPSGCGFWRRCHHASGLRQSRYTSHRLLRQSILALRIPLFDHPRRRKTCRHLTDRSATKALIARFSCHISRASIAPSP
jgi:hypothetical protein